MKFNKKHLITGVLLLAAIAVNWYAKDEIRVENGYSSAFFPSLSALQRLLLGWLPISFGDLLYGLLVIWLIWSFFKLSRLIFNRKPGLLGKFLQYVPHFLNACLVIYLVFNICWGINYNREGIARQLALPDSAYHAGDLRTMNCLLIDKVNESKRAWMRQHQPYPGNKELFLQTDLAYRKIAKQFTFMRYEPVSLKPSIWGWLGNYTGFTGYYNPFTGEAQVNTTVPKFLQPFIACHEVAHQIGYAKEMEANFVGYLAAVHSNDTLFHYSAYLDLFVYANRNLYTLDSTAAVLYRNDLSADVQNDLREWRNFSRKHKNPIEPVISWFYGKFLEQNQQPQGILSYDQVTGLLIAYYKKYGTI